MVTRWRGGLIAAILLIHGHAWAQDSDQPREFVEFRGAWIIDEAATEGLRPVRSRTGELILFDALGLPVPRRLVIGTTATELSLIKDSRLPEVYRFDGVETQTKDPITGALLNHRYRFTLVAESLALTSRLIRQATTEIITDAYTLTESGALQVERQLSYLRPEGFLRTLSGVRNDKQTIIYRRAPE